jgi:FG-GAP-like repeat
MATTKSWRTTLVAALVACGVAAPTAGAATAPPPSQDVNGDGLADVVFVGPVGRSANNTIVELVLGSRDRSAPANAPGRLVRFTGRSLDDASIVGDVNGDGLADILVTSADPSGPGHAWVIYGSRQPAGFALPAAGFAGGLNLSVESAAGVGDVNGDGLADIITSNSASDRSAHVLFGDRTHPLTGGFDIRYHGADADGISIFGVFAAGDANGDGLADVGLIVPDPHSGTGFDTDTGNWSLIEVWGRRTRGAVTANDRHGLAHGTVTAAGHAAGRFVGHTRTCDCLTTGIVPVGDVNGDGRVDLAVGWEHSGGGVPTTRLDVIFGSRSSHPAIVSGTGSGSSLAATVKGVDANLLVAVPGDVNGDGRADLLVSPAETSGVQGLELMSGRSLHGLVRVPTRKPFVGGGGVFFTHPAGDFDGDGHPDVLVGYVLAGDSESAPAHYAVLYGANPLTPIGLGALGVAGTVLPGLPT